MGVLNMKHLLLVTTLIIPSFVSAEPASNMVWLPETLDFVADGNVRKGQQIAAGSRYFCESLFWASQPKQAAKT